MQISPGWLLGRERLIFDSAASSSSSSMAQAAALAGGEKMDFSARAIREPFALEGGQ